MNLTEKTVGSPFRWDAIAESDVLTENFRLNYCLSHQNSFEINSLADYFGEKTICCGDTDEQRRESQYKHFGYRREEFFHL